MNALLRTLSQVTQVALLAIAAGATPMAHAVCFDPVAVPSEPDQASWVLRHDPDAFAWVDSRGVPRLRYQGRLYSFAKPEQGASMIVVDDTGHVIRLPEPSRPSAEVQRMLRDRYRLEPNCGGGGDPEGFIGLGIFGTWSSQSPWSSSSFWGFTVFEPTYAEKLAADLRSCLEDYQFCRQTKFNWLDPEAQLACAAVGFYGPTVWGACQAGFAAMTYGNHLYCEWRLDWCIRNAGSSSRPGNRALGVQGLDGVRPDATKAQRR